MKKRLEACSFCKSRRCYTRIVRFLEPKFDEIACDKHINELEQLADYTLGNHHRHYIKSTLKIRREMLLSEMEIEGLCAHG